jgi:putative membrane protein
MNRGKRIHLTSVALLLLTLSSPLVHAAQGRLGELSPEQFNKANSDSAENVGSIQPCGEPFSDGDKQLIREIALAGLMQIELSKVAAGRASSEEVKMIALGEIAEQTAVAHKLMEIATAGGASVPATPDEETAELVGKLSEETGPSLDQMYIKTSGIAGHEKLMRTMEKVREDAADPALRAFASAALPLIHTHLRVARVESSGLQ